MKTFETILSELGIEVPDDKKDALNKAVNENYKTVGECDKKDEKIKQLTEKLALSESSLKKFEGVNPEELQSKIKELNESLANKDSEFKKQIEERDFADLVKESITKANGKNAKAITALLDMESLKQSKNQQKDVEDALKALAEAEDSKMLFGAIDTHPGKNPIGSFSGGNTNTSSRDARYKDNPFYKASPQ